MMRMPSCWRYVPEPESLYKLDCFFFIFGPHVIEDNIMMARTWNLLDQSSYPLLLECQKRGVLQQGGLGKATREKSEAM